MTWFVTYTISIISCRTTLYIYIYYILIKYMAQRSYI